MSQRLHTAANAVQSEVLHELAAQRTAPDHEVLQVA